MPKIALVWLRNDLRLHDNPALAKALADGYAPCLVYCLDPRHFAPMPLTGLPKRGPFNTRFLFEALADLRANARGIGGEVIVREGTPESILPALAAQTGATAIYFQPEVTPEEHDVEDAVSAAFKAANVEIHAWWGLTMVPYDELPFELEKLPDVFTEFRKKVEARMRIPDLQPTPTSLPALPDGVEAGEIPTLPYLDVDDAPVDPRRAIDQTGGETAALARLNKYIWQTDNVAVYKQTRNGLLGEHFSTKFSAWLAFGCLSPRLVYHEVQRYERERLANESTYWVIFEMLWRDYFKFIALKYGPALFQAGGLKGRPLALRPRRNPDALYRAWANGQTGVPFIDAGMREITETGYLNNRLRQNVASFMVSDLQLDWRLGAEFFEHYLTDYDPASNWGNWTYVAGVGNDPRGHRYFNVLKQALDYDAEGDYVRTWVPELKDLPRAYVHTPWNLPANEMQRAGITLGKDYPNPLVALRERS